MGQKDILTDAERALSGENPEEIKGLDDFGRPQENSASDKQNSSLACFGSRLRSYSNSKSEKSSNSAGGNRYNGALL